MFLFFGGLLLGIAVGVGGQLLREYIIQTEREKEMMSQKMVEIIEQLKNK